jgi:hypothetical protein
MAHIERTVSSSIGITDAVSVATRHYLSSEHLWSARHNAQRCRQLEDELAGKKDFDIEHRTSAMTSILAAVAFLEALVNETFQDAADTRHVSDRVSPLTDQCRALMSEFWQATKNGERYRLLEKYQMALLFAQEERFDTGANPYQDASDLVFLRNKLVHFRPAWQEWGKPDEVENRLKSKFDPSAFLSGTGNPWFPDKAIGAGCAEWACTSSRSFADAWTERLGIPRAYEADLKHWDSQ